MTFEAFPKIPRLMRDIVVTEKLDGTNAQILIQTHQEAVADLSNTPPCPDYVMDDDTYVVRAGSRKRWLSPEDKTKDNFGFAKFVLDNFYALTRALGPGRHYGEWWGAGIQRGYGLDVKVFSLFNTALWNADNVPLCCEVVPVLYEGPFDQERIAGELRNLKTFGSYAAAGFMKPEGIVIYHTHARASFKVTLGSDGHKG